ncbi:cysteine desulfurase [Fusibacter paucivorans]|uniref:Cysteine desulfurase n=1 Tax=Fusibacter paucivorans TaxID=76009 RepID=A0ABS5PUL0_9FIRM|nr:cysteine desulfurase family protein [Fusibacter paucivorans]MBS7528547.1 cysteine desulfurase [Fusibacter paucivorans]
MSIYLDHSATTPVSETVREAIQAVLTTHYGNPSSLHRMGLQAEKAMRTARNVIASSLNVNEKNVIFTSGGTEANNLAILGSIRKERGRLITTAFEHPSVLNVMMMLEKEGYDVVYLEVDALGQIDMASLSEALTPKTQLVSIMHTNNEIGSLQPIETIGSMIEKYNQSNGTKVKFHVDAVQAYGKTPIDIPAFGIDLLTISSHKINGLKGTGALICREGIDVKPRTFGGGQERGIRPGTENVVGIVAFGAAAKEACEKMNEHTAHVALLKKCLLEKLADEPGIRVNGEAPQTPYILSLSFEGVKGEVLLHSLEMSGIYVSTGSACNSKKNQFSHVLSAIKLPEKQIEGTIRVSFSALNTIEEIDLAASEMLKIYKMLLKMMKRR